MEAARKALARHRMPVEDEAVITVIIDGRGLMLCGCAAHNAKRPTFRHRVGAVTARSVTK